MYGETLMSDLIKLSEKMWDILKPYNIGGSFISEAYRLVIKIADSRCFFP